MASHSETGHSESGNSFDDGRPSLVRRVLRTTTKAAAWLGVPDPEALPPLPQQQPQPQPQPQPATMPQRTEYHSFEPSKPRRQGVVVFAGANGGPAELNYAEAAQLLGQAIARRGMRLVYGGGGSGLMGAVAQGYVAAGGQELVGVAIGWSVKNEGIHESLRSSGGLIYEGSIDRRIRRMLNESDIAVVLPGGAGTLHELCTVIEETHRYGSRHPLGFLNVGGFWDDMWRQLVRMSDDGMLSRHVGSSIMSSPDPDILINSLCSQLLPSPAAAIRRPERPSPKAL